MEKKIKTRKQRKGITLIALVLTIIVLLILAGITINLTIGQDGILMRAQEAGAEHEKAQLKEELELAIFDIRTEKLSKGQNMTREDLIGLEKIGAIMESTGIPAEGEYKDHFFEVDENYVVTIIGKLKGEKPTVQAQVVTTGIVAQGGKVEIKVIASISEGNITEIVATNGAVLKTNTSATEKVFEVSANGTYTFKVKADNGRSATSSIEVNTILEAPQISIKDETDKGFTIVVNNNYPEGLITEYKYYVGGEIKSSGTTNKEFIVTGLKGGEYTNIYVEAYCGESTLTSNIETANVKIGITSLNVGDYIKYDTGVSEVGANGVITCRVLYPASSEYGLQIISDKNVKNVRLGVDGDYSASTTKYNNAIETLNNEAETYINSNYAYDARCVGSAPTVSNGMFINKNKVKFEGITDYVVPGTINYVTPQFTNASYVNSYGTDINYETDQMQMQAKDIWNTGEQYWLASRRCYSDETKCNFYVRYVNENGGLDGYRLSCVTVTVNTYGYSEEAGIRPCISLKSDIIKITGGTGENADNAYVIGK